MHPLLYPILLLPYPLLVFVRFVGSRRSRIRFPAGAGQSCGYDLKGSASGSCPECGSESAAEVRPQSIPAKLRSLPWKRIGICVVALLIGSAAWYAFESHRDTVAHRINPDAEPLAEFQRVLPMVASGEIQDRQTLDAFGALAANHCEVRKWMTAAYASLPGDQQYTLMHCVLRTAPKQTFEELAPMLVIAINNGQRAIAAVKALRYYDLPDRREILQRVIGATGEYEVQAALSVYLDVYGVAGIKEALDKLLEGNRRDAIGAILMSRVEGPLRDRALQAVNNCLSDGRYSLDAFYELVGSKTCGDDELLGHARRLLGAVGPNDKQVLQDYIDMCSS